MEEEAFVLCHTESIDLVDMASKHPIIQLPVYTHSMAGRLMVLSLVQAVAGFHGVEAVAGFSVAGEGSVVGDSKVLAVAWGPSMEPNPPNPFRGEGRPVYRQAWVVFLALCATRFCRYRR